MLHATRSRRHGHHRPSRPTAALEPLEPRLLLAAAISSAISFGSVRRRSHHRHRHGHHHLRRRHLLRHAYSPFPFQQPCHLDLPNEFANPNPPPDATRTAPPGTTRTAFAAKYNYDGRVLWSVGPSAGTAASSAQFIDVTSDSRAFVAGSFSGAVSFPTTPAGGSHIAGTTVLTAQGNTEHFLLALPWNAGHTLG